MKKITFQFNDKMKEHDQKRYEDSFEHLENLENKKAYLLKDDRTEIKAYRENKIKDIKSVFLIVIGEDFEIKIKGNLSFNFRTREITFYPIFVSNYGGVDDMKQFLYEIDLSEVNDNNLSRIQMNSVNERIYKKITEEFADNKYTPVIASSEWKSFIEPYEYYVDLKFKLLKQDFEFIDSLNKNYIKVIKINRNDSTYLNYFENELYEEIYDVGNDSFILVDYLKYNSNFKNEYLRKNSFLLTNKTEKYSKDKLLDAKRKVDYLNKKFKTNIGKTSFFSTSNIYTANDLRSEGKISKNDIEIHVGNAYVKDPIEEFTIIDLGISSFIKSISQYKEFSFNGNDFSKISSELIVSINNISKTNKNVESEIKLLSKNLASKKQIIVDEDIEFANEFLNSINEISLTGAKGLNELLNDLITRYNEEVESIKESSLSSETNLKETISKKVSEYNTKIKNLNKDKDKNKIKEIQKIIKDLNLKLNNDLNFIRKRMHSSIENINNDLLNKSYFNKIIDELNFIIKDNSSKIENIVDIIKGRTIRTVEYSLDINILFNFIEEKNSILKDNLYMLNTGDMILVDTIKRIIASIKRGEETNNTILKKIIRQDKMNTFIDSEVISTKDQDYLPNSYSNLNESQQKAFRLAIDKTDPIAIIQGPPGTGKTEVITNIVKFYRNKGERVILSSQTNVAIKNVLDKLCSNDKVSNSVVIPWLTTDVNGKYSEKNISETWYDKFIANIEKSNEDYISKWSIKRDQVINEKNFLSEFSLLRDSKAIAATTTTSKTLPGRGYDSYLEEAKILIIDEVSKSILPEILRYSLLNKIEKVILVGDYKQLNPIFDINIDDLEEKVDSKRFKKLKKEIEDGIFYRLAKDAKDANRIVQLDTNYRSVPGVLDAYNVFYNEAGTIEGLKGYRDISEYNNSYSFNGSTTFEKNKTFYYVNVMGTKQQKQGTSRYNKGEIKALLELLHELADTLENSIEKDVAIIFPYAAQIRMFSNRMKEKKNSALRDKFKSLKWDTVDSFQGAEANIVFLSTVVTEPGRNFLTDFRRVNVSVSRAKDMLVLLGNSNILKNLEIGGEGIETRKYLSMILDQKNNEYLKVIRRKMEANND